MNTPKFKEEFHLTDDGWIGGNSWAGGRMEQNTIMRPINTVETWVRTETGDPRSGNSEVLIKRIWSCQDFPPLAIAVLHGIYPPNQLAGRAGVEEIDQRLPPDQMARMPEAAEAPSVGVG